MLSLYDIFCYKELTLLLAVKQPDMNKMARTEQTPKNPVRDRPIAAMESDLYFIEGRLPPRPTNQGGVSTPPSSTLRPKLKPQVGASSQENQ